jgi:hypothetical protein
VYETQGHSRLESPPSPASENQAEYGYCQAWEQPLAPLDPMDTQWDPAEELANLLHEAIEDERNNASPSGEAAEVPVAEGFNNDPLENLTKVTDELPPLCPAVSRHGRRSRSRSRERGASALSTTSFFLAAFAAVVVSMVCFFGGIVSYDPLRRLAEYRTATHSVGLWPILVYGPWMVASLSILRAALHRCRATHSWVVVVVFSSVSMLLCVAQAPRTPVDAAAAALPAVAALASFQQFVRQVTLTRRPRQTNPRHRTRPVAPHRPKYQRPT